MTSNPETKTTKRRGIPGGQQVHNYTIWEEKAPKTCRHTLYAETNPKIEKHTPTPVQNRAPRRERVRVNTTFTRTFSFPHYTPEKNKRKASSPNDIAGSYNNNFASFSLSNSASLPCATRQPRGFPAKSCKYDSHQITKE